MPKSSRRRMAKPKGDAWFESYIKKHAFRGELELDIGFEMLGQRFSRRARIVYAHTPEWMYYDPKSHALRKGSLVSTYHIELLAPSDEGTENNPNGGQESHWFHFEGMMNDNVMPTSVLNAIADAIDETCKEEDARRRRAAGVED